jgi:hypothetical protein
MPMEQGHKVCPPALEKRLTAEGAEGADPATFLLLLAAFGKGPIDLGTISEIAKELKINLEEALDMI